MYFDRAINDPIKIIDLSFCLTVPIHESTQAYNDFLILLITIIMFGIFTNIEASVYSFQAHRHTHLNIINCTIFSHYYHFGCSFGKNLKTPM